MDNSKMYLPSTAKRGSIIRPSISLTHPAWNHSQGCEIEDKDEEMRTRYRSYRWGWMDTASRGVPDQMNQCLSISLGPQLPQGSIQSNIHDTHR